MTKIRSRHFGWWWRWGVPAWPGTIAIVTLAVITLWTAPSSSSPSRASGTRADSLHHPVATAARLRFEAGIDTLAVRLDALHLVLKAGSIGPRRAAFRAARVAYKRIEGLLTVYSPPTAALLNGPTPEENEDRPAGPLGAPAGFQIVEAAFFAGDSPGADSLEHTVVSMRDGVRQFRTLTRYLAVSDAQVLDAERLELARVATLGLAGFDSDQSGDAIVESAEALRGSAAALEAVPAGATAVGSLNAAASFLQGQPEFGRLDRLTAIADYLEPAARAMHKARLSLAEPFPALHQLWRPTRASVFEAGALDPSAFAPTFAPAASPDLISLGRQLFFEPRLSGPATRSCASCHQPANGFTDRRPLSLALPGTAPAHLRNTPTLLNAAFEPRLFADSRVGSLESQVEAVIASPVEMGGSVDVAAQRLSTDSGYRGAFARAFHVERDKAVNARALRLALAAFVRSLHGFDSRFDRAIRGDSTALSADERRGFTVFMGKARCGTCHFLPLFNGTMPPDFAGSEPEIIGVPAVRMVAHATLDTDPGRAGFDHEPAHRGAFKVPTLRNVALTAPYMHNGALRTLEEVIDFYERGGGTGIGAIVPGQTLPARRLHLTTVERRELIAFLGALTDSSTAAAGATILAARGR